MVERIQSVAFFQCADTLGLHITDHKSYDFISRFGAMSAGRLGELTGLTTGAVTGIIDRLEEAGYVRRTGDPKDRRRTIIGLSETRNWKGKWKRSLSLFMKECTSFCLLTLIVNWLSYLTQRQNT